MNARRAVWLAALLAFLARFPSLVWPLRADEAGLLLVARAWDPQPDSLYGHYWVDRPPVLVGLVRGTDALGGPGLLRLLAAIGLALMVLLAADAARSVARLMDRDDGDLLAAWAAVGTTAMVATTTIEPLAAKSEVLGVPLVMLAAAAALRALRGASARWAVLAGLAGMLAVGMKQNMVGGLVLGGVLLLGALVTRRLPHDRFLALTAAALAGAAVPVLGCVVWALAAGVDLSTLWYQVYGFRSDAVAAIAGQPSDAPAERGMKLLMTFVGTGMLAVLLWYVARARAAWRLHAPLVAAVAAMLLVDGVGLVLGGSFWQAYLLVLVPGLVLALVLARAAGAGIVPRFVIGWLVASTVVSLVTWSVIWVEGANPPTEVITGRAVGAAAEPGDTMMVFGGRADVQEASGLPSPYEHLWSLPMRVLDPQFDQLRALVESPDRPTWVVEWVEFGDWDNAGADALEDTVRREYVEAGEACSGHPVWLRRDLAGQRPDVAPDCEAAYRPSWWP